MTDPNSTEHEIVVALRKIVRAVDLHNRQLIEVSGVTGPQLATLQAAHQLGPASAIAISRAVHLSQGTVTGILSRLESRGLITRAKSEADRRAIVVTVTAEGEELLGTSPSLLQDRFREALRQLQDWERTMILSAMQRVASLMDAEGIDASPHLISDTVNLKSGGDAAGEVSPASV